jgi:hypothetical protein
MRLYEVAGNQFQDDLAEILRVLQGRADSQKTTSVIPWSAVNNMLSSKGYSNITQDLLVKVKDKIDKDGELIQNITPNGIVLKTKVSTPEEPKPAGGQSTPKSVDQMARNAAKDTLK